MDTTRPLRRLILAVVVGAVLDVGVFVTQEVQFHAFQTQETQIQHNAARANCWANILDAAIKVPPPPRAELLAQAGLCAQLPSG